MPGYVLVNMELDRRLLAARQGHARASPASSARPTSPCRSRSPRSTACCTVRDRREGLQQGPVRHRRVGQGHLGPAVGLLRRDLRDQPGRAEAQGARVNLRSRDARRGGLRPGQEDLGSRKNHGQEGPHTDQAAGRRRAGLAGAAGRPRAGSARHQHHGVLQGVQRPDPAGLRHRHPGRHHRVRGPLVHVRHEDAAGRRAHQAGHRPREGLGRAQPRQGRQDQPGPGARDRREEAARPQRPRRRPGGQDHRGHRPLDGRGGRRPDGQGRQDYLEARGKVDREREYDARRGGAPRQGAQAREVRRVRRDPRAHGPERAPRRRAAARHDRAAQRPGQERDGRRLRQGRQGQARPRRPAPTSSAPTTWPSASRRASPTSTSRSRRRT